MLIDPGHGGSDSGCHYGTLLEKNLVLDYALDLGAFAKKSGRNVRYTRTDDRFIEVNDRGEMVLAKEVLISCHINATDSTKANGASVWYHGGHEESYKLAVCIFQRLMMTHLFNKYGSGVISDLTRYTRGFGVLRSAVEAGCRAAVLLEPGFLSNPKDRNILTKDKNRVIIAKATNDGLNDYLEMVKQ